MNAFLKQLVSRSFKDSSFPLLLYALPLGSMLLKILFKTNVTIALISKSVTVLTKLNSCRACIVPTFLL